MYGFIAFVTQTIIYGFGIIMSIVAYMLYRDEFKGERKQCIVFSLGMGIGMFLLQYVAIELLSISVSLLAPNGKSDAVISIIARSFWSIGAVMIYYIGVWFASAEIVGRFMKKLLKKTDLGLRTVRMGIISIVWQVLAIVMIIILYGSGSI